MDYQTFRFDLDTARTDPEEVPVHGRSIVLTKVDSEVTVHVGSKDAPGITIDAPTEFYVRQGCDPISKFYFSHDAGAAGDVLEVVSSAELGLSRGDPHRKKVVIVQEDDGDPQPVVGASSSIVRSASVSVGTSAAALAALECQEVVIRADPSNTANIFVGNSSAQAFVLEAGDAVTLPVTELSDVHLKSASGSQTALVLARD